MGIIFGMTKGSSDAYNGISLGHELLRAWSDGDTEGFKTLTNDGKPLELRYAIAFLVPSLWESLVAANDGDEDVARARMLGALMAQLAVVAHPARSRVDDVGAPGS
jgi:hypothetical protein